MSNEFTLSEMFTLEIKWDKVVYESDEHCELIDAYFTGPALSVAQKIEGDQHIMLDFREQYPIITKNYYVAKFSWKNVTYNKDNTIGLSNAYLSHVKDTYKVPRLKGSDYIVIDTENHQEHVHAFNLVYRSFVVNGNFEMYNFRK
jgi:hypothetical protein